MCMDGWLGDQIGCLALLGKYVAYIKPWWQMLPKYYFL